MFRCLFLVFLALAGIAITYRGRKFSGYAFWITLFVDALVCMTFTDHATVPEVWQIGAVGAIVFGLLAQVLMAIWYATVPPVCPHCGNVGRLSQRVESI